MMIKEAKNISKETGNRVYKIKSVTDNNAEKALQLYILAMQSGLKPEIYTEPNPILNNPSLAGRFKELENLKYKIYDHKGDFVKGYKENLMHLDNLLSKEELKLSVDIKNK